MQALLDAHNSNPAPVKTVRVPSLQSSCIYLMRDWVSGKHSVVLFNGCKNAAGPVDKNFALKEMREGDVYCFTAVDGKGELYTFEAYAMDACLCVGTSAARATFSSIACATYPEASVLVAGPVKPAKPRKLTVRNADEGEEPALYVDKDLVDEAPIGVVVGQLKGNWQKRNTVMQPGVCVS